MRRPATFVSIFKILNANKKSATVDLKDRNAASSSSRRLVKKADVFAEKTWAAPGGHDRASLGSAYDVLKEINPRHHLLPGSRALAKAARTRRASPST